MIGEAILKRRRVDDVVELANTWLAAEPDQDIKQEMRALIAGDRAVLTTRFTGQLEFGTAGLRAAIGAGPQRMNRLTVRQAAAGLVDFLFNEVKDLKERGILIGYDMRHKSDLFAWDTARVAAARGVKAMLMPEPIPTPVLAWNITRICAAAGVMVTASHNPPADNGYKVYLESGSQIVPPFDSQISAAISRVDPTCVKLSDKQDLLISILSTDAFDEYVSWVPSVRLRPDLPGVAVAYTAMHGVGGKAVERAFQAAGLPLPQVVEDQQQPDGTFPTVSFPNPEEPGAMDMVMSLAKTCNAKLALANDPDADRLGVAIPLEDGSWRRLSGDEVGWLLADYILRQTSGNDRLVVTTLVSSSLLGKMAATHGVAFEETFTGFKCMAQAALKNHHKRLVFAYEQALGYLVTDKPLDKDGITAAVVMVELASCLSSEGSTLERRLAEIAEKYGRHMTAEISVRMDPAAGKAAVQRMRYSPPAEIAGMKVATVVAFPEANLLRIWLVQEGGIGVRVQVRPSGTEPKVKLYGEAVDSDPIAALHAAAALLIA